MKKTVLALTILALLLLTSFSANAYSELKVPAVDSDKNGLLTIISAEATPGTGKIDVEISPFISVDTQQSIRTAVEAATSLAGKNQNEYNYHFTINTDASSVDGPSGGAALALLTYAELTNKKLRADASVTGTIDAEGVIGHVGGVKEKLEAANKEGIRLLLLSKGQSASDEFDYVAYAQELSNGAMQAIETASLEEAAQYIFTQSGQKIGGAPLQAITPLTVSKVVPSEIEKELSQLAQTELLDSAQTLKELIAAGNITAAVGNATVNQMEKALKRSLSNAQLLLDNGYYYSAANTAFLAQISLDTVKLVNATPEAFDAELEAFYNNSKKQFFPIITAENLEWLAGAQLRFYWAQWKITTVEEQYSETDNPDSVASEYATAKSWLRAAKRMTEYAAAKQGTPLVELNARNYALRLLDEATQAIEADLGQTDDEIQWHFEAAKKEFSDAAYVASTFDSQFVISYSEAKKEAFNKTSRRILSSLEKEEALPTYSDSLWSEAYFIHSLYNLQEANRTGDNSYLLNALKLQKLARAWQANLKALEIELITPSPYTPAIKVNTTIESNETKPTPGISKTPIVIATTGIEPPAKPGIYLLIAIAVLIAATILVFALFISRVAEQARRRAEQKYGPIGREKIIEKLDLALAEGRLSERLYEKILARYQVHFKQATEEKEGQSKRSQKTKRRR